jgi:ADP-L-glycero-D-manno-heptose 6-epimerase
MRILITGNRGFIGGTACGYFSDCAEIETLDWGESLPDLTDVDWVMHFGGLSSTAERDVDRVMRQNYDYSCWLLDQCLRSHTNLQYSSSASIYGDTTHFTESGPVDPRSAYAWSKYLFERYAAKQTPAAQALGLQIQGFRYFNVYGAGEDHKDQPSAWSLFRRQARSGEIRLFEADPEPARDMVPVDRVMQVHHAFLDVPESGVWNVGTGRAMTFRAVAERVAAETGAVIRTVPMPAHLRAQYQYHTQADLTKLLDTLSRYSVKSDV